MGHYHCEVIIPPTTNVESAVQEVLGPFSEHDEDSRDGFWDFFVIGGRFSGEKLKAKLDPAKLQSFYEWLKQERVTVSAVQCGKQTLSPVSQVAKVDDKWNELFPSESFVPCPIFSHSNDQYAGIVSTLPHDVEDLADLAPSLKCFRVLIAGPSFAGEASGWTGPLRATYMLTTEQWNGVNHMNTDWDGSIHTALSKFRERLKGYADGYVAASNPQDDWLAVTVDYHS